MKICDYCGTAQKNDVSVCPACGGNELSFKCKNCGTLFKDGVNCPSCGLSVYALPKHCPRCSRAIYTDVCPGCGYRRKKQQTKTVEPEKPRRTWLWVLGWIFCFPIPVTVLVLRAEKIRFWLKILLIVLAWAAYILIYLYGDAAGTAAFIMSRGCC